jgi:PLP dependent protein
MIKEEIENILNEISSRARLVVAVKYANAEEIKEIVNLGIDIGFNTFQQFEEISQNIDLSKIKVHFIGHIQSNKIAKIIRLRPFLIQSDTSYEMAEKINYACEELKIKQKILLQVNSDPNKTEGFQISELKNEIVRIQKLPNIEICGFMTIPPEFDKIGEEKLKEIYEKIKSEYDFFSRSNGLNFEFLSMGMSKDYMLAVNAGANMVRVGRKIFE